MIAIAQSEFNPPEVPMMDIDIRPATALAPVLNLPAAQNPARVYLASLANGSHRAMIAALDLVADLLTSGLCDHWSLPWWLLRYQHTMAVRAWLMQNRAPATGNKILSALRGTLRTAWRMGQMETEEYLRAIDIRNIKGETPDAAAGRALAIGEFNALLQVCAADPGPAGPRDASILGLGVLGGLRRAEMAQLELSDYDPEQATLWIHGKRQKQRIIPVANGVCNALDDWVQLRGQAPGPLFLRIRKGGTIVQAGISEAAIYRLFQKRAVQAGVKDFSPHDLRRTFAGELLDAGADIAVVQRLMGHASANTTAKYDRRGERAKRDAVDRLHMAWERRYSKDNQT